MVALSGGVDSSAVAAILKEQGLKILGATLRLYDKNGEISSDIADAKSVCQTLNIDHHVFDLCEEFKNTVIKEFIDDYLNGLTPNPCTVCNKQIKFGEMLKCMESVNASKIATGHYARLKKDDITGRTLLLKAKDQTKDQTYMLYSLSQQQLSRAVFPLGDLTKAEAREIAAEHKLITHRKSDSQDICFVPDGDYAAFIEKALGIPSKKGNYLNIQGEIIGQHSGVIRYTVGQRKGLGVAFGRPQFVIGKNAADNTVTLGDEEHLFKTRIEVKNINYIPFDALSARLRVKAKLRYRHVADDAWLIPLGEDSAVLEFDRPQRAPTSGQAAVFYDGEACLGGGIIV
jgi:tRNA-specific 2-thiouridylase